MSADAIAVLIRQKHVVGTDCDEPGVTDFHLVMKLEQTLGLAPILRAESSPAKHYARRRRVIRKLSRASSNSLTWTRAKQRQELAASIREFTTLLGRSAKWPMITLEAESG